MGYLLARILNAAIEIYVLVIIADVVVSYFLSPYHRVREFLDRLVQPLLNPIRRIIPLVGPIDFSPLVLLLLVQWGGRAVVSLLATLP